jgi:hypothetical protein
MMQQRYAKRIMTNFKLPLDVKNGRQIWTRNVWYDVEFQVVEASEIEAWAQMAVEFWAEGVARVWRNVRTDVTW